MPDYSLADLAKLADVTPRTIRFYIAQGLLPSPGQQGPATRYTDEHLERLLAIKKLQAAHLPLAEIRTQLRAMGADDVSELAETTTPNAPRDSAVDYIQSILRRSAPAAAAAPALQSVPAQPSAQPQPQPPEPGRSQWDRVAITPDIELHVRRPLTRGDNKRVSRLIEIARQLFEEE